MPSNASAAAVAVQPNSSVWVALALVRNFGSYLVLDALLVLVAMIDGAHAPGCLA